MHMNCFDWDDNIIFMPTNIVLFNEKNEEVIMTTEDFSIYRGKIGTNFKFSIKNKKFSLKGKLSYNLKDFFVRGDHLRNSSFREFRDCKNKYFLSHLEEAVKNKKFAPEWSSFISSLESKKSAQNTFIITARGHSPSTIYKGLKLLKEKGLIKHLIPLKNIFPVSHSKFKGSSKNPQKVKLKILKGIISKANTLKYNSVSFSDDDHKTISFIDQKLTNLRNLNYWQNLSIKLKYTGQEFFEKTL